MQAYPSRETSANKATREAARDYKGIAPRFTNGDADRIVKSLRIPFIVRRVDSVCGQCDFSNNCENLCPHAE
jgi:hypothetical protein